MNKGISVLVMAASVAFFTISSVSAENKVVEDTKKAGEAVGHGVKKAGEATVHGAKKVGEATVGGAKKVGGGMKKGVVGIGHGAKKAGEAVKEHMPGHKAAPENNAPKSGS